MKMRRPALFRWLTAFYVAFTWTVQYYFLLLVALVLALATSWLLLVVLAKTKALLKQD